MNFLANAGFSVGQQLENTLHDELVEYGYEVLNDKVITSSLGDDVIGVDFYCRYGDFVVTIKINTTQPNLTEMVNFIYSSAIIKDTVRSENITNVYKIYASSEFLQNAEQRAAFRKNVNVITENNSHLLITKIIQKIRDLYEQHNSKSSCVLMQF
jgi:hypothetical protein